MFVLEADISIGKYRFNRVNNIKVVRSVELLSDTAEIKLPITAFELQGNRTKKIDLSEAISAGDAVSVTLKYKGVFEHTEFKGYVKEVKPNRPTVTIVCEDAVYLLRKKNIRKNFGKTDLKSVLSEITGGTGVELSGDIPEVNFDNFILKDVNGAKALQKIKENYGLSIYIDDEGKLFAGLKYTGKSSGEVKYDLNKNVIKADLQYKKASDVKLYVKVIGVLKDNTKIEVMVGDSEGEQRTIYKYNVSDKKTLEQIGKSELADMKYDGYRGSLTGFLVPFADRGMQVALADERYPKRAGTYFIDKVETTFGANGARRKVYLGIKL